MKNAIYVLLGLVLAVPPRHSYAASPPPKLEERLKELLTGGPGGAVVARKSPEGKTRFVTIGRLNADDSKPMTADTLFEIGSITKMFTGLLLAQAVVEGRMTLDDRIARHLPAGLQLAPEVAAITLGQLATHTSGLPRVPPDIFAADPKDPYARYDAAALHACLNGLKLGQAAPRPVDYSNLGVALLGHLLSRVYGRSYADLLAEKITRPLGLHDTVITPDAEQQERLAAPYSGQVRVSGWHFDVFTAAGAIRSSASDLVRFVERLTAADSPLKAAWQLARQPRADFPAYGGRIGLGVIMSERDGELFYGHDGGTGGYRSYLEFSASTGALLAVLINNDAHEGLAVASAIREWEQPVPRQWRTGPVEQAIAPEKLAEYAGVFAIDDTASFTALIDPQGRLVIRLTGQSFFPAYHMGNDRFFLKVVAAEYQFARDKDGRIGSLTLHQNGHKIPAKRTAKPIPPVLARTSAQLAAYTGSYELTPRHFFEVSTRDDQLMVKLSGQPAYPVFCEREDRFAYDVVEAALTFERDASGKVVALVLHQGGLDQRARRKQP